jgi:hypothetical protein
MVLLLRIGCRRTGRLRSQAAELVQHNRIDARRAVDALLEVLDARPRLEIHAEIAGCVPEPRERRTDLDRQLPADRQPAVRGRRAEIQLMKAEQALELAQRRGVVVDPQIDGDVGASIAASAARDNRRSGEPGRAS